MASSLHLSYATATRPRASFSPKPSHLLTHANQSHHRPRHLSCSKNQNEEDITTSKKVAVDRRNMLLGLGGLYAGTHVLSGTASAEPIEAPPIKDCHTATYLKSDKTPEDEQCCPPILGDITNYTLPPVSQMKMRPSAHRVSPEYMTKYKTAIGIMKNLPDDDPRSFLQQAHVHCAYCNAAYKQTSDNDSPDLQVHYSWLFFPFHRWYLYFYERILGKLIGDPNFALPFWTWDNPEGMTIPPMFDDCKSPLYDIKRNPCHRPPAVVDLGLTNIEDPLQLVANNLTIMHNEMIRGNSDPYDFMGQPYRLRSVISKEDEGRAMGSSERGSHNSIHAWVGDYKNQPLGEDMGNFYSAGKDPLFYCHHANVDRMWTLWQYFLPSSKVPDKTITDPDFLNASFLFYDENKKLVRVRVEDCLDNLKMGYEFERIDLPWLDYRPPPQTAWAKINRASSTVEKASTLFPLVLDKVRRFEVEKKKKGKADEVLVIKDITVDTTKLLKFDVFVNDEDDKPDQLNKAAYLGTFAQVPHRSNEKFITSTIKLKLTALYEDMDVEDDENIVVTIVPRHHGPGVTIGGVEVALADPPKPKESSTTSSST